MSERLRCWLVLPDGARVRLGAGGTLLGREADCDVVLADNQASRRHALVRLGPDGPELVPMGKNPTLVDGKPVTGATPLAHGATIRVPGRELGVVIERAGTPRKRARGWVLVRGSGDHHGLHRFPFTVGGGEDDDLVIPRWPAGALRFASAQGALFVEAGLAAKKNGQKLIKDAPEPLDPGDAIEARGERLVVDVAADAALETTVRAGDTPLPDAATLQFLPRGGRLTLELAGRTCAIYLADRRCDLIAALLQPPRPHAPGEWIEDDVLAPLVWPKRTMDRTDLNVLVYRARRDLIAAGANGSRLLERSPGGGATRFALAAGARVEIHTE